MRLNGYSLLELSIVLLILAIFSGGLLQFLASHQEGQNIVLANERLDEINESVKRFYARNGYLPCPAQATRAESNASFGKSTDCSDTTSIPNGTWEVGSATNTIRIGVVPIRALGLSPRYMYDAWGGKIEYGVIKRLAIDKTTYGSFSTALNDGVIRVLDAPEAKGGHSLVPSSTSRFVAYILISAGPDKKGAYGNAGILLNSCGSATNDAENCNYQSGDDRVFADMPVNTSTTASEFYHDYLRWTTNEDLEVFIKTGS